MIYLEKFESYINDDEVYEDLRNFILFGKKDQKLPDSEMWGIYDRRWFNFRNISIYVRHNVHVLDGQSCPVLDIADIDTKGNNISYERSDIFLRENCKIYEEMLLWIINNFPKINLFIEAQESVNAFKIFGQYINQDGTPTYLNILDKLGFKKYPKNHTMFYLKR